MADDNQQTNSPAPQTNEPIQPPTIDWPKPDTAGDLITRGLNPGPISRPQIPDNVKGS
jgi:hypothetical protein